VSTTGATGAPGVDVGLAARLLVSPTAAGDSFTVSGVAGALAPTTPAATIRKTGASTSEASDRRRSVARPVRVRTYAITAGTRASSRSRRPSTAVAGKTASRAPSTMMTNVVVPKRLRGGRGVVMVSPVSSHGEIGIRRPSLR
jgi:hypothetical protein